MWVGSSDLTWLTRTCSADRDGLTSDDASASVQIHALTSVSHVVVVRRRSARVGSVSGPGAGSGHEEGPAVVAGWAGFRGSPGRWDRVGRSAEGGAYSAPAGGDRCGPAPGPVNA